MHWDNLVRALLSGGSAGCAVAASDGTVKASILTGLMAFFGAMSPSVVGVKKGKGAPAAPPAP